MSVTPELLQQVKDYVLFRSPSTDVESDRFAAGVTIADDRYSVTFSKCRNYYQILGLYVLHMYEVDSFAANSGGSSLSGPVKKKEEGDLAIEMAVSSGGSGYPSDPDLSRTGWGVELKKLMRGCIPFTAMRSGMFRNSPTND